MSNYSCIKLLLLLLITTRVSGQEKYWIANQETALNQELLSRAETVFCSDWIKACSYRLSDSMVELLRANGIAVTPVRSFKYNGSNASINGFALEQIGGHLLIDEGLSGKGVKIGIIDGGFYNLTNDPSLRHLLIDSLILGYNDYLTNRTDLLAEKVKTDTHGTEVIQLIGGINEKKDIQYGLATSSQYYLAKTDSDGFERRLEEDNMIKAMEWMDGEGIQIINISLGYTNGFNNKNENYQPEDMNGEKSAIARAVEHASLAKGILVVVAAGNEGNNFWKLVSTPGDARHALTVGSTKIPVWDKMNFSSIGPDFLDYLKPDIAVFSGIGTSYSAPVITGLAACIKEFDTSLTNLEIIEIIQKSGHLYPYPNNYLGYGVPKCSNILAILNGKADEIETPEKIIVKEKRITLKLESDKNYVVLLHKNNQGHVINRQVIRTRKSTLKIKRFKAAHQSTIIYDRQAKEVVWK